MENDGLTAVEDWRLAASVLLLGGLLLALLAFLTSQVTVENERLLAYLLAALGVAAFLAGGSAVVQGELPGWLVKGTGTATRYFGLSTGQVLLLLFALCFSILARLAAGDLLAARHGPVSATAWILALLCAAGGALGEEKLTELPITWADIYFTAFVFGVALLLRGLATELIPNTFSGDEGGASLVAAQFTQGNFDNLFTVGWFDFPSLYFAMQGLGIGLLGHTVPAVRLVSAIGGALTVVGVYWLARVTYDVTMARIVALVLLASHFHIHMSRIALNNVWDGFFAALAAAGLWYGWSRGRHFGFVLAGLCLGVGQYFYATIRALPLIFLVWTAVAFFTERQQFQQRLPGLILSAYIALIAALPIGLFYANHPDQLAARSNHVTIFGDWMESETAHSGRSELQVVADQFSRATRGLVNEPLRFYYEAGVPLLLGGAAVLFITGLLWGIYTFDLRILLLLLPIVASVFIVAVSRDAPAAQRYIMAAPFIAIFVALPIGLLTEWLRALWPDRRLLATLPAVLLLAAMMLSETFYYFNRAYDHFLLGGLNTLVATRVAQDLQRDPKTPQVVFYGFPRMGFQTHATVPYLVPAVQGYDVMEGALFPENWSINGRTRFIFLPERIEELQAVQDIFPGGQYEGVYWKEELLYAVYTVE
jgi:4-amino-4-deoxy-L-arabinose transferase-like glycosyltransferase